MGGVIRLYIAGGVFAALLALIGYNRWDAARDARAELEAAGNAARLKHIEDAKKDAGEVKDLSDADLCNDLGRVLSVGCPF